MGLKEEFLAWVSDKSRRPFLFIDDLLNATLDEAIAGIEKTTLSGKSYTESNSKEKLFTDLMYYWVKTTENVLAAPNAMHTHIKMPSSDYAKNNLLFRLRKLQKTLT
jgi:hypothetical protein